jgi:hypothetical protein
MSITAERRMHRYSEEDVAAVVLAAVTELRARQGQVAPVPRVWDTATEEARSGVTEAVRSVRSGALPRERYEASRGADDPPYAALNAGKQDEDRLLWLITQAMTGE